LTQTKFPTTDLDMYIYDPQGNLVWQDEGSEYADSAPERATILAPEADS
jgi:hypothetical protein